MICDQLRDEDGENVVAIVVVVSASAGPWSCGSALPPRQGVRSRLSR